ncbi:MAG: hypothetical protein MK101_08955 [Phycisphaerales bacterium]|nr:hypothetical protein [Phycisphaerales bacterium]
MSKRRHITYEFDGDLPEGTGDDAHWVVYTRKNAGGPARWAGYLDAVDVDLALQYSREHYGLDEACVGTLIHRHDAMTDSEYGLEPLSPASAKGDDGEPWVVFVQKGRGNIHIEAGLVHAPNARTAIARGIASFAGGKVTNVRVVLQADCHEAMQEDLAIWREHDLSYKYARGYSKDVRAKWRTFRDEADLEGYRAGDIKEHF